MLTHVACTLMVIVVVVRGMPTGAPRSACNSLTPVGHNITNDLTNITSAITAQNAGADEVVSNYTVTISADSVEQGGTITVSIMAANGTSYKGFLVAAVVRDGLPNNTVGKFNTAPADAMWKNGPCLNEMEEMSSATHNSSVEKNSTVLTWKAPTDYTGDACIRGAIVKDFATWWELEPKCFTVEKPEGGDDGKVGDDSKDSSPSIIASVAVMFTAAVLLRL